MRLAVVYPSAAWSTRDVAAGYARAFELLGHDVLKIDLWQAACRAAGTEPAHYARAMAPEPRRAALKEALAALRRHPLDWMVAVHGRDLPLDLPDDLRKRGTRSALLLTDEPYELEHSLRVAKGYELVVTNDPATLDAHRANHPNAQYLPPGFDPEVMRPDPEAAPAYDLAFVGTWFKERVRFFEALRPALAGRPCLLAGYWFKPGDRVPEEDLPGDSPLSEHVKPMIVWPSELCRVYQRTRISLNLHRGSLWHANPGAVQARGVNPRLFEIAGCGAFQMVDARDEVRRCFAEDEVQTFRDVVDCARQVEAWLAPGREADRRAMAERALRRARAGHTYARRAGDLLRWMG
jgi:spore maturation protein CgeB